MPIPSKNKDGRLFKKNPMIFFIDDFDDEVIGRFWSKVDIKDKDSCWNWKGGLNKKNYGCFTPGKRYNSGSKAAHRYGYLFGHGKLDEGLLVCHKCDNPSCVNPNHLWQGTPKENSLDMISKGRSVKGGDRWNSNLTGTDVKAIKAMLKTGRFHQKKIASMFGIKQQTISSINNDKSWRHI